MIQRLPNELPCEAKSDPNSTHRGWVRRSPSWGGNKLPKCRPWSTTKRRRQQTPRMRSAQIWQEHENLNAVPLGRGSCTAVHRLPDIQFLPNSTYSLRYADSQLGTGGCSQGTANESGSRPTAATRSSGVTRPCPKNCWEGNAQVGWVFFLSSSSVSRDSEKARQVLHKPSSQVEFEMTRTQVRNREVPTWGIRFLFTQTNFQPPQNENWQRDVLICMHKTHTLLIQSLTAHPGYFTCTGMPVCEHQRCADKSHQGFQTWLFSSVVPDRAIGLSMYKMLRKPSSSHALSC